MSAINFDNLPIEPTITIINPNGSDLITTNNPIAVLFARLEIKHRKWEGYKIRTANGNVCTIGIDGKIRDYPDGEIPGDVYGELLTEII